MKRIIHNTTVVALFLTVMLADFPAEHGWKILTVIALIGAVLIMTKQD